MTIEKRYVDRSLELESQEINIFKTQEDNTWNISTTIPKYARKYRPHLLNGVEIYNRTTDTLIAIHGQLSNKSVTLNTKREISDDQREILRKRMLNIKNRNNQKGFE